MVTCEEGEEVEVHGTHATCYIQNSSSLLWVKQIATSFA